MTNMPGVGPEGAGASTSWEEVLSEVARDLEAMRRLEVERRTGGLRALSPEQRATIERLTRELIRRAVLEGLEEAARLRGGMSAGEIQGIREMFASAT